MHLLRFQDKYSLLFLELVVIIVFVVIVPGQSYRPVTFYENYNTQGRHLHFRNIRNCTVLPPQWAKRVSSLDTHDNCFLFYDKPGCSGNFLQATVLDEESSIIPKLKSFGFNNKIQSLKPCGNGHIRPGRSYKIQNVANRRFLTADNPRKLEAGWTKLKTKKWKKELEQQWKVEQYLNDKYFLIPRTLPTYSYESIKKQNGTTSTKPKIKKQPKDTFRDREPWDLVWLFDTTTLIRNIRLKKCLEMTIAPNGIGKGNLTQSRCNNHSENQQWIFHELKFEI